MIFFPFPSMSNSHWQIWSGRDCKRIGASGKTTSKQLHDPKLPFLCRQEVSLSPAYLWKRPLPPRFAACHREKEKIYRYSSMATYTILRADEVVKLFFVRDTFFLCFFWGTFLLGWETKPYKSKPWRGQKTSSLQLEPSGQCPCLCGPK